MASGHFMSCVTAKLSQLLKMKTNFQVATHFSSCFENSFESVVQLPEKNILTRLAISMPSKKNTSTWKLKMLLANWKILSVTPRDEKYHFNLFRWYARIIIGNNIADWKNLWHVSCSSSIQIYASIYSHHEKNVYNRHHTTHKIMHIYPIETLDFSRHRIKYALWLWWAKKAVFPYAKFWNISQTTKFLTVISVDIWLVI